MKIDTGSSLFKAGLTFVIVWAGAGLLLMLISNWIEIPGTPILSLIGGGWAAYYVYNKAEGRLY